MEKHTILQKNDYMYDGYDFDSTNIKDVNNKLFCTFTALENLGSAGIFMDRKDTAGIAKELRKLMTDDEYYNKWSKKGLKRAKELSPKWDELEQFLLK